MYWNTAHMNVAVQLPFQEKEQIHVSWLSFPNWYINCKNVLKSYLTHTRLSTRIRPLPLPPLPLPPLCILPMQCDRSTQFLAFPLFLNFMNPLYSCLLHKHLIVLNFCPRHFSMAEEWNHPQNNFVLKFFLFHHCLINVSPPTNLTGFISSLIGAIK